MDLNEAGAAGVIGVALLYILRAMRDDIVQWRQRANGGTVPERTVTLLERIDRQLSAHHGEMARYQAAIAALLGEIKGRLGS